MKPVPMKFGEYVWHHNPQNISFECDRRVAEMKSPFGESSVQDMGRKNMKSAVRDSCTAKIVQNSLKGCLRCSKTAERKCFPCRTCRAFMLCLKSLK